MKYKEFITGQKVWLEGSNLKRASGTPKLSPKRYGPFPIQKKISHVAYQLQIPEHWRIHNVFHTSLLTPYKETEEHGPNFLEPPPDIINDEPEWEVETIIKERNYGAKKKKQYLVRWKGYSPAHDSWVDHNDMNANELIKDFHNKNK